MQEMAIDLWDAYNRGHMCCITINGYVRKDGQAVMGRGIALQARRRFPGIAHRLGTQLGILGNHVQFVAPRLLGFPVKPVQGTSNGANVVAHMCKKFPPGSTVPGWAMLADPCIIERSLLEVATMREPYGWGDVFLPRPGCGAGGLDWEAQVKPLCEQYGDWLIVVTLPTNSLERKL